MAANIREEVHKAVDRLSEKQLTDTLYFVELLMNSPEGADVEPEEMWLLATGALKKMVDEIDDAPPPVDDWRKHLRGL